jgi:DNA-binding response OmpR family regulator
VLHVCIVGPDLTTHQALIERLRVRHAVTLVAEPAWLEGLAVVAASDAVALEADGGDTSWREQLQAVLATAPGLPVVLVEGDLTDEDRADAFALGALDLFPTPCPAALLAERLEVLANLRRTATEQLNGAALVSATTRPAT